MRDHDKADTIEQDILPYIVDLVTTKLRYSVDEVISLNRRRKIRTDAKVALDLYIREGVGVARHQVLLTAYLLEKLKSRGLISGCFFLDDEFSPNDPRPLRLFYIARNGAQYVFDPLEVKSRSYGFGSQIKLAA